MTAEILIQANEFSSTDAIRCAKQEFVIKSEKEYGFWSDDFDLGWVADVESATKYSEEDNQRLSLISHVDAQWLPVGQAVDFVIVDFGLTCKAARIAMENRSLALANHGSVGDALAVTSNESALFVIKSEKEYGFWSNDLGWVADVESATKYTEQDSQEQCLMSYADTGAQWFPVSQAVDFDDDAENSPY